MIPVLRHKLPSLVRVAGAACIPVGTKQPSSSLDVACFFQSVNLNAKWNPTQSLWMESVTAAYRHSPRTTVAVGLTGTAGLTYAAYHYATRPTPARPNPPLAAPVPAPLTTHHHQDDADGPQRDQTSTSSAPAASENRRLHGLPAV